MPKSGGIILVKTEAFLIVLYILFSSSAALVTPLFKPKEGRRGNIQAITWNCVRRLEAITLWKYVQSRGYPRLLNVRNSRCSWKIVAKKGSRIRLAFRGLDLYADDPNHCSSIYIEIIDETIKLSQARYCGKKIPNDIVTEGNKVRIDFQAQPGISTNSKGFNLAYAETKDAAGFYSWQSFGPKKRVPLREKVSNSPTMNDDDPDDSEDFEMSEGSPVSPGTVVGAITAVVAVLLIVFLVYKKRKELRSLGEKLEKDSSEKKQTVSRSSLYPLTPQTKPTEYDRRTSSDKPLPVPPEKRSQILSNNRDISFKQTDLPSGRVGTSLEQDDFTSSSNPSFRNRSNVNSKANSVISSQSNLPRRHLRSSRSSSRSRTGFPDGLMAEKPIRAPIFEEETIKRPHASSYRQYSLIQDNLMHDHHEEHRYNDQQAAPPLPPKSGRQMSSLADNTDTDTGSMMHSINGGSTNLHRLGREEHGRRSRRRRRRRTPFENCHGRSKSTSNLSRKTSRIENFDNFNDEEFDVDNFDRICRLRSQTSPVFHDLHATQQNESYLSGVHRWRSLPGLTDCSVDGGRYINHRREDNYFSNGGLNSDNDERDLLPSSTRKPPPLPPKLPPPLPLKQKQLLQNKFHLPESLLGTY